MAVKNNAVNLGQGFPDFEPEPFMIDMWAETAREAKAHWYIFLNNF